MQKVVIIAAGGSGKRMGSPIPKQFLLLKGKPLLLHTILPFLDAFHDIKVIISIHADYIELGKEIVKGLDILHPIDFVMGGETRFHSVQNGLEKINGEAVVFIHDAARCLISKELIKRCYEQALVKGSAIPIVTATDSIRIGSLEEHSVIDRDLVKIVQTPQTFLSNMLFAAFRQPYSDAFTDEATVVEKLGSKVFLLEGENTNIKVTRPIDLVLAERLLA